jgi:N6-L-threonylcarbamoyladenine synthase
MITLGIETSCDETGIAVVKDGRILSNEIASSLRFHKPYGGIVPEIATRFHVEAIEEVFKRALLEAGVKKDQIDLVSFTYGPGLVGSLLVGVSFAKALGFSLNIPIIGINHLQAHTFSAVIDKGSIPFPFISLIISGGHTGLAFVRDFDKFELLGQTLDDALGEAFDKVSKILGYGYPGGPIIEKLAKRGNPDNVRLQYNYESTDSFDFSFSGIKTAVLYYVRDLQRHNKKPNEYDIAGNFQQTVIKIIFEKIKLACEIKGTSTIMVSGGVSINKHLRNYLRSHSKHYKLKIIFPKDNLCLDNGAMVASLGEYLFKKKRFISNFYISAVSNLGFDSNFKGEGYDKFTVNN